MKNRVSLLLSCLLCILLTGCSCQHQWTDATCTAPRSCSLCGITEGDTLEHSWLEADCVTAKTCSICGLADGSALGHSWTEATCTVAKTCTACGLTEGQPLEHRWVGEATLYEAPVCSVCGTDGEPLPGYLAQNGLVPNVQPNTAAEYITCSFVRDDFDIVGTLLASEVSVFESDSTHRYRIGYEWRRVDIDILFDDSRSSVYGTKVACARADYYQEQKLTQAAKTEYFALTYNGKEYNCMATYENMGSYLEDGYDCFRMTCYVQVPVGYDGIVLAFYRGSIDVNGKYLPELEDENMLLFRMA